MKQCYIQLKIDPDLKEYAVHLAKSNGLSLSGWIKYLISQEVKKDKQEQ